MFPFNLHFSVAIKVGESRRADSRCSSAQAGEPGWTRRFCSRRFKSQRAKRRKTLSAHSRERARALFP